MLKLDFTLATSEERSNFIDNYLKKNSNYSFSNSELETIANYILYGKDSKDGESVVDRKEVQIKTKYNSYKKKEPESLNELMENPTFDERIFIKEKNRYRNIKPKIDRKKDYDIPTIQELWETIDYYQYLVDCNTGKINDPSARKLSQLELYKIKHMIIDLRRQQFTLKDIFKPTVCLFGTTAKKSYYYYDSSIPWDLENSNFSIAPLGVLIGQDQKFLNPREYKGEEYQYNSKAKYIIDFRELEHIYYLLENYEDLKIMGENNPESTINFLLDTLNFYIELANLSESKKLILDCKKKRIPNEVIKEELFKKYELTHSANYISTLWKQKICGVIAEAAKLHYDYYLNRNKPFAWKKCNQCGKIKLKDTREFMRKSRSSDGLSNKCKECDRINRLKNK